MSCGQLSKSCQKMQNSDFQSQFSMSKMIRNFLIFFHFWLSTRVEFEGSEKGRSLISAYRRLAITASTSGFEKLSTALLNMSVCLLPKFGTEPSIIGPNLRKYMSFKNYSKEKESSIKYILLILQSLQKKKIRRIPLIFDIEK